MYLKSANQMDLLDTAALFAWVSLNPQNEWIALSRSIPWAEFEQIYAQRFQSKRGRKALPARMALGTVIIAQYYHGMSDEEIVRQIGENPYLQFFIGMLAFAPKAPFHSSMISRFRKRIPEKMMPQLDAWVQSVKPKRRKSSRKKTRKAKAKTDK